MRASSMSASLVLGGERAGEEAFSTLCDLGVTHHSTLSAFGLRFRDLVRLRTRPVGRLISSRQDRKHYIVLLLVKLKHKLHSREFVDCAEVNRGGGTQKIHSVHADASPGINVLEIQACRFLLKQNSHLGLRSELPAWPCNITSWASGLAF